MREPEAPIAPMRIPPADLASAPFSRIASQRYGASATHGSDPVTLEAVLVVIGVIATVIFVAALVVRLPVEPRAPASRARASSRPHPTQLLRIERVVQRSGESGPWAQMQLRPLLREIAEARLARRGLRLDRDEEEARRLLGAEAWELVRLDHPSPRGDRGAGIATSQLEAVLDRLEAL
jgi:hypothetical protein